MGRYYDPATGQFLSVDPLVDQTGQPYSYVGDDPVDNVDPSGLFCWSVLQVIGGLHQAYACVSSGLKGAVIGTGAGLFYGAPEVGAAVGLVSGCAGGIAYEAGTGQSPPL